MQDMKYCKYCGQQIHMDAVICVHCGRQVEELRQAPSPQQPIVIHNINTNVNNNNNNNVNGGYGRGRALSKWTALLLCFFLGFVGAHKFYEGKKGMGILYIFTLGLFGLGWLFDFIALIFKPDPYYV